MKIENMKLLDLETGKYLELGDDWWYCGEYIKLVHEILDCVDALMSCPENGCYEDVLIDRYTISETQEPLKTLCENTGAVIYGGRYVLIELIECLGNIQNGDIIRNMVNTGLCCNENVCEFIVNTNDYYSHQNLLLNNKLNNKQVFKKSNFEDVLKQVRTDFEYASNFFDNSFKYKTKKEQKILTPQIKEMMIKESDKKIEIFYFERIVSSGLYIIGNIFEEYSKQLRNEPNKFEELMELII